MARAEIDDMEDHLPDFQFGNAAIQFKLAGQEEPFVVQPDRELRPIPANLLPARCDRRPIKQIVTRVARPAQVAPNLTQACRFQLQDVDTFVSDGFVGITDSLEKLRVRQRRDRQIPDTLILPEIELDQLPRKINIRAVRLTVQIQSFPTFLLLILWVAWIQIMKGIQAENWA